MNDDYTLLPFTVGQTVIRFRTKFCNEPIGPGCDVEITKVGRKWVYLKGGERFDRQTMCIDGGGWASHARIYPNLEAHERDLRRFRLWRRIKDAAWQGSPPANLTLADLVGAAGCLKCDIS